MWQTHTSVLRYRPRHSVILSTCFCLWHFSNMYSLNQTLITRVINRKTAVTASLSTSDGDRSDIDSTNIFTQHLLGHLIWSIVSGGPKKNKDSHGFHSLYESVRKKYFRTHCPQRQNKVPMIFNSKVRSSVFNLDSYRNMENLWCA